MKYSLLGISLLVASMAIAAGVKTSLILPPSSLPQGTVLYLLDKSGKNLWQSNQPVRAATVIRAAYLEFSLPGGKTYTYRVVHPKGIAAMVLDDLKVQAGKHDYTLTTLLENRNLELGKNGTLANKM